MNKRTEDWGRLLAELSVELEKQKQLTIAAEKEQAIRFKNLYQPLENLAANFEIESLKSKLLENTNKSSPKVEILNIKLNHDSHSFSQAVYRGFKTNRFIIIKATIFLLISCSLICSLICLAFVLPYVTIEEFLSMLISIGLLVILMIGLLVILIMSILQGFYYNLSIKNHKQIKLPELRLLFLELKKFSLKPELIVESEISEDKIVVTLNCLYSRRFKEMIENF